MPTQEERLTTVERDVALLRDDIRDINHNETILLGLVTRQGEHIREIRASLTVFEQRVNQRLEALEQSIKQDITGVKQEITGIKQDISTLDGRFDRLEQLILDRLPPSQG